MVRFVVDGVTKLVFVSVAVEADGSTTPTLRSSLLLSPPIHLLYWGTVYQTPVKQIVAGFHPLLITSGYSHY